MGHSSYQTEQSTHCSLLFHGKLFRILAVKCVEFWMRKNVIMFDCGKGRPWASYIYPHLRRNKFSNIYKNTEWLSSQKELDSILILNFWCIYLENLEDYSVYFQHVCRTVNIPYSTTWRRLKEMSRNSIFEGFLLNSVDTFIFWLRLYKNNGHFTYRLKVF
jgi:hypothetical protein